MKVRLVYRNYKPLHAIYQSLVENPPEGVTYIVPPPNQSFNWLFPYYRKLGDFKPVQFLIKLFERLIFLRAGKEESADIVHYINMVELEPPKVPFVVEFEHPIGLFSFVPDASKKDQLARFLNDKNCLAVICLSEAAKRGLGKIMGPKYRDLVSKVQVVYPGMKPLGTNIKPSRKYLKPHKGLNLLFIGNGAYRKGLGEVLISARELNEGRADLRLHVISDDAGELKSQFPETFISWYQPKFSKAEIIRDFFLPADLFVLPTKTDTFGMVFLDALSTGTPVIATRQYAIPELVTDGRDGILLAYDGILDRKPLPKKVDIENLNVANPNQRLIKDLKKTLKALDSDRTKLKAMSRAAKTKFQPGGKFSISRRNKQLLKIYKQAK